MPRYINEDELCKYIRKKTTASGAEWIVNRIKEMPSDDVAEVKHGKWETVNEDWDVYECSVCQHEFMLIAGKPRDNSYNFCPNCGADMDTRGKTDA